jgi:hypothetical protein
MINNFKLIRELLSFPNENDFYFLQILKRRKDNPGMTGDSYNVDNFYIYDIETFDKIEPKVIDVCERNNARAYIRLNRRNSEKVALNALKKAVDYIVSKDYRAMKNLWVSACGDCHSDVNKTWIVDIDNTGYQYDVNDVIQYIALLKPIGFKTITTIPTKSGIHIISKPFRLDEFRKKYPAIDVHKDNPTVLYCV